MDEHESRVSQLLHAGVPEPRRLLRGADVRALDNGDQVESAQSARPAASPRRWLLPLLAAVVVLIVGATTAAVLLLNTGNRAGPATPIGPVGSIAASPSAASPSPSSPGPSSPGPSSPGPSSSSPATSTGSNTAASTTCRTDQLQLATAGPTEGAAGTSYTPFSLTNTAATSCLMQGYPGVSLLDPAGAIVGQPAARVGAAGDTIVVPAGGAATFTIGVNDVTQLGCQTPRPSTQLQVYPPNQTAALRLSFTTGSCAVTVTSVARPG
jgi:hypothetical protein